MSVPDYHGDLVRLIEEIRAHPQLRLDDDWVGEGLAADRIEELEGKAGIRLPDSVRAFYGQVNGAVIRWSVPDPEGSLDFRHAYATTVAGSVNLSLLDELLQPEPNLVGSVWDAHPDDPDAVDDLEHFHTFDRPIEEIMAGYLEEDGAFPDEVFYLEQENAIVSTERPLESYWSALVQSRGIAEWQRSYMYPPKELEDDDVFFYLRQLFPEEGFGAFVRRSE